MDVYGNSRHVTLNCFLFIYSIAQKTETWTSWSWRGLLPTLDNTWVSRRLEMWNRNFVVWWTGPKLLIENGTRLFRWANCSRSQGHVCLPVDEWVRRAVRDPNFEIWHTRTPATLSLECPSYSKFSQLSYEPGCGHELWWRKCDTWFWNKYVFIFSKSHCILHIQR